VETAGWAAGHGEVRLGARRGAGGTWVA